MSGDIRLNTLYKGDKDDDDDNNNNNNKVKCTPEQVMKAESGYRGIAVLFL